MKILHVVDSLGAGGAEKLIDEILPELAKKENTKVELLLLSNEGNVFLNKILESRVKITYSPINDPKSLKNIRYLYQFIKKEQFDIVHSHLFPENYFVSLVSFLLKNKKTKFITTEHNTHNRRRDILPFKIIEKVVYKYYDLVISITQATQESLIAWINPQNLDKYVVINNGVDISKFDAAPGYLKKELDDSFTENSILLCMVGRFFEQKDQATIIRALQYLPNNVQLVLVGDGEKKSDLIDLAHKVSVQERVKFLGLRNDIANIYKTIDIPIVSSKWEGFGLVAVEAMAAGKPLVASDVPGLSQIVKNYGVLFEQGNPKGLAHEIEKLLESEIYYTEISRKCFERSKQYDISRMITSYYEHYKKIIDKNKGITND